MELGARRQQRGAPGRLPGLIHAAEMNGDGILDARQDGGEHVLAVRHRLHVQMLHPDDAGAELAQIVLGLCPGLLNLLDIRITMSRRVGKPPQAGGMNVVGDRQQQGCLPGPAGARQENEPGLPVHGQPRQPDRGGVLMPVVAFKRWQSRTDMLEYLEVGVALRVVQPVERRRACLGAQLSAATRRWPPRLVAKGPGTGRHIEEVLE